MIDLARSYLREAEARLRTARRALKEDNHAYTIRQSQECIELSLKAALRVVGVEYPKKHDVSIVLRAVSDRFPAEFRGAIPAMADASSKLAEKRSLAMYGDELRGLGPNKLFSKNDAADAVEKAEFVFKNVQKLLSMWIEQAAK